MPGPTFAQYSKVYDLIYADKPYGAEVDYLEALFRRYRAGPVRSVLDIACGTGSHVNELARRGYTCAGSDLSQDMIRHARAKAAEAGLTVDYQTAPMQSWSDGAPRHDAVLCMFSAIDYLPDCASLKATLAGVRARLAPGGLFIFDFWNGLEASRAFSPVRVRECRNGEDWLLRISRSTHDPLRHTILVQFEILLFQSDRLVSRFIEEHPMRYYYPREMEERLADAGLEFLHVCPFLEADSPLRPTDWNVSMVARAPEERR